ncbi:NAD(P)-binding protein [Streptomyces sp. TG1A-8]|uniref:protoporphyrinogen/coproporphyrinogen oxidase n=1 Tax=Streptomyces sp. TG1A-8 TaxID=3051385 RepID=UPI00265B9808|nr:FAD-dependent oxidoreductase [Streptomyces sp. TG1A-8]MDO0925039.1 NAD(P)-binding protein [Streptomyces sp. TG1A-8]
MLNASSWTLRPDHEVRTDVLILGGGLAGLAAGSVLGDDAVVIEAQDRPGGLVRTERIGDYWFDHVIHLLYFSHPDVEARVTDLLGDVLRPCPPVAWVETAEGAARFPLQLNLSGLPADVRAACIDDMRAAHAEPRRAETYEDVLLGAFGRTLCELFFFPYNRKQWRRPLSSLSADGFHWNLTRPSIADVEAGANSARTVSGYNARGWYPRPAGHGTRGMEVLSRALAGQVADLRLGHTVIAVDPGARTVRTRSREGITDFRYTRDCVSTLPLPTTVGLCRQAPADLVERCRALPRNRVRSVALAVHGPRPEHTGHWRYYTREDVPFTRLVFMTEFDPAMAPPDGWGLLAEVVEPSEDPPGSDSELIEQVVRGVGAVGLLTPDSRVVASRVLTCDPAYVVFTDAGRATAAEAARFLTSRGLTLLGRYGTWEYSSMSQVMQEAFAWAADRSALRAT